MILETKKLLSYFPLIFTATLGALNDNLIKAAIIIFAAMSAPADQAATVGLLAGGLLMLPFVLFSGWAGIIADKFEKARMIRIVKWSELGLSVLATGAMLSGSLPAMLGIVFLMGTQSAFFGPLKLGWLPERLSEKDLVPANSYLDTGTFFAILAGTVAGGLLAGAESLIWVGAAAITLAVLGVVAAHVLPTGQAAAPDLNIPRNPLAGNWQILKALFSDRENGRAALLDTWFWVAGSVYLSALPAYLRLTLGGGEAMLTAVMAIFAVGIGTGAFAASAMLRGKISARLVLPSSLIIAVASFGLTFGFDTLAPNSGMAGLFATTEGLFVVACLTLIAFGGGMFAIPLKAFIQSRAGATERAQVMAGFNILSSIGIVLASIAMSVAIGAGLSLSGLFLSIAISAVGAVIASVVCFPRAAIQGTLRMITKIMFRVEVTGREHLDTQGPVVFVSNHVSFADGPLLFSLIDREVSIAVYTGWAKGALARLARPLKIAAMDPQRPMAAKGMAHAVRDGGAVLIFPEGRISTHGALMKVYPGTAWLVDAAQAPVVSISIEGLESSIFNRPIPGMARRLFPKVRVRVCAPQKLGVPVELKGRARREVATRTLQDILEHGRFEMLNQQPSIPHAFHASCRTLDAKATALSDPLGTSLTRGKIAIGAAAFSAVLQRHTAPGEHIGVLLPGVAAAPIVLMGLWRAGRVAAILNPTLGVAPMMSAIDTGGIKQILTSQAFIDKANLGALVKDLEVQGITFLWTDALKAEIGTGAKIRAIMAAKRPTDVCLSFNDTAVILFTSGTEGAPKGVVLTHGNLVANLAQLRARTDVGPRDKMLSALPLFHSFGLTGGVLLPMMTGAHVMIYPTPLHYRIIPELAYGHNATLLLGTDTFLSGWGRRASAYDFASVRAAIAGAEPVKQATRALYSEKFGVRILEGFGATEAGPVVALNTPMENRSGTVGRVLSHIETRLDDVAGVDGKRLWIKGPNIMAGYLLAGDKGKIHAPEDGWYDTGDIVTVSSEGYMSIVGRAKRFAKVGGEMVSLAAAEVLASTLWPDAHVAALSTPDARKGEKVILITTQKNADRKTLSAFAKEKGTAEITVPSEIIIVEKIPLLASGKTDYPALSRALAQQNEAVAA
ncbi:MFS transporter [Loktanella sp. DJP18]|uniref:MFS transporter n=1 Tax=Loktanella sp. DJP18 TaxID=3409788 RepID=UPI003BB7D39C